MSPLALTKKLDPKTNFGYDFAEIFMFSKIEKLYITTFISKTLDIPNGLGMNAEGGMHYK